MDSAIDGDRMSIIRVNKNQVNALCRARACGGGGRDDRSSELAGCTFFSPGNAAAYARKHAHILCTNSISLVSREDVHQLSRAAGPSE